jgi:hypothetical protein
VLKGESTLGRMAWFQDYHKANFVKGTGRPLVHVCLAIGTIGYALEYVFHLQCASRPHRPRSRRPTRAEPRRVAQTRAPQWWQQGVECGSVRSPWPHRSIVASRA